MAKAKIYAGACGFSTQVTARMNNTTCHLSIESECKAIMKLAAELTEVDPYREFTYRRQMPQTHELAAQYCSHAACPVPAGIIKAVEIAAGLNLPADVSIELSKDD